MLRRVYDLSAEGLLFETKLPKSFVGLLVSSLGEYNILVKGIYDKEGAVVVDTSCGSVTMWGTFSVNDVIRSVKNELYRKLNRRFDRRVALLESMGYKYYKECACFAMSEKETLIGGGISNAFVMHAEEIIFKLRFELCV